MLRSDKHEPHQEHRPGTVSNTITGGLKPVLRDPNLTLGPSTVHTSTQTSDDDSWNNGKLFTRLTITYETSCQTSPDQSDLSLPEIYISVTVPNHLRPILEPFLRLNPNVDHCPLYTVYWDHCLYDVWTTVRQLLREIHRTTATQALPVFCCPLHLMLGIYRVRTAFNT